MKRYIKSAVKLEDVPEENKHGNCYVVALHKFMENPKRYTLVHGVVTGQGPLEGLQYNHAWVIDERNEQVIDMTQPAGHQRFPVGIYYMLGKISLTREYKAKDVYKMLDKYGTYGPWDKVFDAYP